MMRHLYITLALLSVSLSAASQDIIRWTAGPLTWDKFTVVNTINDSEQIWMPVNFEKKDSCVVHGNTKYKYTDVNAVIMAKPWVYRGNMTEKSLLEAQAHFDLAQNIAHQYRDSLLFCSRGSKEMEKRFLSRLNEEEKLLSKDRLASVPAPDGSAFDVTGISYSRSNWSSRYGAYAYSGLPMSYLKDFFSSVIGGGLEVGMKYRRVSGYLDLALAGAMIQKNNYLALSLDNTSPARLISLMIRPGIELTPEGSRISLTAFSGLGLQSYRYYLRSTPSTQSKSIVSNSGFAISEGLKASFQMGKTSIDFSNDNCLQSIQTLDLKIWSDQILLNGFFVPSVYLSIGYSINIRTLKR